LLKFIYLALPAALLMAGCSRKKTDDRRNDVFALREMSDLATVEYTVSKVVKASDGATWFKVGKRKIALSVQAYIKAGIDLGAIKDEQVIIEKNKIIIQLPRARLISLNIPPEEIREEVEETGFFRDGFTNTEKEDLLTQAEHDIRGRVDSLGVLKTAEDNALFFIGNFVKRLGYTDVTITFDDINRFKKQQPQKQ
jgi:Protein of unknown function (DUF4230)